MKKTLLSLVVTVSILGASENKSWNFDIELYALAPFMSGEATVGTENFGNQVSPIKATPGDILEVLEMGFMGHFEAKHKSNWGLWLDYVFMDLGASGSKKGIGANVGLYQGIFEGFVTYKYVLGNKSYLDYYGGVRWWHNEFDFTHSGHITSGARHRTIDWYDPVIGIRYTTTISDNWNFVGLVDIGGFGIASDFSTTLSAGAVYDINDYWHVDLKYKALWVDYKEGTSGNVDYFRYDNVTHGPVIGINYSF